ncbi:aminomethyltransferase [Tistlia consotensis]|uniref:Aminomethyltransferase n=1 Tax=Tistlia consotensis USBA 355 TaxID=560819 RepID=A0A1Y6BKD7_9PROT|nr:aminomethyltransferase family protein [Tistlia consotensis]SMF13953.1 aminomethyltransferase [Tistlia consotensis USBA 355]SNR50029.1 aminomethyltransferase [Tistlia consotensis]
MSDSPIIGGGAMLQPTPFHRRTAALNLVNAWERWQGHTTVTTFLSPEDEYFATRTAASLYDVSPMLKYRIAGPDAEAMLDRLMTRDVTKLKPGRALYGPWCDGRGRVIEEGTLFRESAASFRLNAAEPQLFWLEDCAYGFDVTVEEVTDAIAGLALQGPLAKRVLEDIGLGEAARLPFFGLGRFGFEGGEIEISRTGFTGDLGFELWIAPERAETLWDRLMAVADRHYLRPMGSQALNTLRIEAGHILINVEYVGANHALRESQMRTPDDLGLGWAVDPKKPGYFNGRRAIEAERAAGGPRRRLVGLDIEGRKPAHAAYLYAGRREVGQVTSACWSPVLKRNIALATVEAGYAEPGRKLKADVYYVKEVTQGRVEAAATVVEPRFYQPAHRRG